MDPFHAHGPLARKWVRQYLKLHGVTSPPADVVELLAHAVVDYLVHLKAPIKSSSLALAASIIVPQFLSSQAGAPAVTAAPASVAPAKTGAKGLKPMLKLLDEKSKPAGKPK